MSIANSQEAFTHLYDDISIDRRPTSDFLLKGPLRSITPVERRFSHPDSDSADSCPSSPKSRRRLSLPSLTRKYILWVNVPTYEPDTDAANQQPEVDFPKPDKIAKEGWLKKQKEGVFGHWRERWCVMYESGLFRYYSQTGMDGELDELYRKGKGDVSFVQLKTFGQGENFLWVGTRERMWRFDAGTEEEAKSWLAAMTAPYQIWAEEELKKIQCNQSAVELSFSEKETHFEPLAQPPQLGAEHKPPTPSKSIFTPFSYHNNPGDVMRSTSIFKRSHSEPNLAMIENPAICKGGILKEGWLHKKGGKLGIWRKRWCVLYASAHFEYFSTKDKNPEHRKGKGDNSFRVIQDGGMSGKEFWIETNERTWEFRAETLFDAAQWFDMFTMPSKKERISKAKSQIFRRGSDSFSVWGKATCSPEFVQPSALEAPHRLSDEDSLLVFF